MNRLFFGIIIGIVLATVGVDGVANILHKFAPQVDGAISNIKEYAKAAQ